MISDADRAAVDASVAALEVDRWRPLDSTERDLVKRALAPPPNAPPRTENAA